MLSQKETKTLVKLLRKIPSPRKGLSQDVFEALLRVVPFAACELVIVNSRKEILLTWRDDKWWTGWHLPGGLLRFRESFEARIKKTALMELGVKVRSFKFLFPVNYNHGPRGHAVSLFFLCQIKGQPTNGKFFKTMPKQIIAGHWEIWRKVKQAI